MDSDVRPVGRIHSRHLVLPRRCDAATDAATDASTDAATDAGTASKVLAVVRKPKKLVEEAMQQSCVRGVPEVHG